MKITIEGDTKEITALLATERLISPKCANIKERITTDITSVLSAIIETMATSGLTHDFGKNSEK